VDDVAPLIFEKLELSVEICHWIVPVYPLNVSVVLFVPEQTDAEPEAVPATEVGATVIAPETFDVTDGVQVPETIQ
jgi:hypothetical protein